MKTVLSSLAIILTLLLSRRATANAEDHSGWSINLTPVLLLQKHGYHFGGGADPELKYTLDMGGARLSAGGRIGTYYAKDLLGVTAMPTLRMMVPVGIFEPYVAFGMGYGWLPKSGHKDIASMSRVGFLFRLRPRIAIGLEATFERIDSSRFRFPSFGSMMSFDL